MKKAKQAVPNQLLKEARELRGWSQKFVAEQIGADHYYLSRWERGTATPSPYYRQKLCVLFGKNAKELGLLQEVISFLQEAPVRQQEETLLSVPFATGGVIYDPAIPL